MAQLTKKEREAYTRLLAERDALRLLLGEALENEQLQESDGELCHRIEEALR